MRSRRAQVVGQGLGAVPVGEGELDGQQPALGAGAEHRQEPGVARVGRVELHDQAGPAGGGDGRAQRSSRLATSAPAATGAAKVEPSRRVTTDSAVSHGADHGRRGRAAPAGRRRRWRWR